VEEIVRIVEDTGIARVLEVTPVADHLGVREQLLDAVDANPLKRVVVWREASRAALTGDLVGAADILSRTGNVAWEAVMRFHAGEQLVAIGRPLDGEAQLHKALDFYRSVGASYYLQRGEALLARTA
jgi:hypothetical protein